MPATVHCPGCSGSITTAEEVSRKAARQPCPGIPIPEAQSTATAIAEKAAETAAQAARRETLTRQEDVAFQAIVGYCQMLEATGQYQGRGQVLARKLAELVVGRGKMEP